MGLFKRRKTAEDAFLELISAGYGMRTAVEYQGKYFRVTEMTMELLSAPRRLTATVEMLEVERPS